MLEVYGHITLRSMKDSLFSRLLCKNCMTHVLPIRCTCSQQKHLEDMFCVKYNDDIVLLVAPYFITGQYFTSALYV